MDNPTELKIWQTAYYGVVVQGALAKDEGWTCYYRIGDLKCGVGHLLTDDEAVKCKGKISRIIADGLAPKWMTEFRIFLRSVQDAHDFAENIYDFKRRMLAIKPDGDA